MRSPALLLMTRWAIAHMENTEMKFPRFPHLRTVKFAPVVVFFLFFITNLTGFYFSPVFAPSSVEAKRQDEFIPLDIPQSGDCDLDLIIFRAGERAGVDPRFIHAVIQQESRYDPKATSPVGARGLMQLMPATGKRFDCNDLKDQACNVEAGTKYLAWLLKRFNGDVSLALAGYNAGEGAVDKYKGVPPYHETENYVKKIVSNYGKTYHPILSPDDAKVAFHLTNDNSAEQGE
ncbi:MAG: hypothetical protein DMF73_17075 [Acidobacteria bacterium]|nr:MAG: hypothetical protein DMF73_17075 [Acidobacteriota bacterium]